MTYRHSRIFQNSENQNIPSSCYCCCGNASIRDRDLQANRQINRNTNAKMYTLAYCSCMYKTATESTHARVEFSSHCLHSCTTCQQLSCRGLKVTPGTICDLRHLYDSRGSHFTSRCRGRRLSTWPTTAVSCPTALGALCAQLTFRLAWCSQHSVVMATELLQPPDLACGTLFQTSCVIPTSHTDCSDDS